jgi:hypothetical protein
MLTESLKLTKRTGTVKQSQSRQGRQGAGRFLRARPPGHGRAKNLPVAPATPSAALDYLLLVADFRVEDVSPPLNFGSTSLS